MKTHFKTPAGHRRCNDLKRDRRDARDPMKVNCIRCLRGMVLDAERGPPDALRRHHETWQDDAAGFVDSVKNLGFDGYEQAAAVCEWLTGKRPSQLDRNGRATLLYMLRDIRVWVAKWHREAA